jgi:uncharacterized protein (TIGR03790 family)
VYVSGDADSTTVATEYASKRGVPAGNLCAVTLANPAFPVISPAEYTSLRNAVRTCLTNAGRQNILYIVLAYVRPFAINPGAGATRYNGVDSYLSDPWDQYAAQPFAVVPSRPHAYYGESQSQGQHYAPFQSLADYRASGRGPLIYSVWRLDGPTPAIARALVDKALAAEAAGGPISNTPGVNPNACIDMLIDPNGFGDAGLRQGDWDLFRGGQMLAASGRFQNVISDVNGVSFGTSPAPATCPNTGLYVGWYNYYTYNDAFTWIPGAIGWDLNSVSAADPRGTTTWVPNALARGITITSGPMDEPYLEGMARPAGVIRNLLEGANAGDAFLRNTRWLKWRVIHFGDPLYQPFGAGSPAPVANSLWLNLRDVVGGSGPQVQGRVTLSSPAPLGGVTLNLSTNWAPVTVPATVTIPQGATSATFPVTTPVVPSMASVLIYANGGPISLVNTVTLYPLLSGVGFSTNPVKGGLSLTGTVYLNASAPLGGVTVQLASDTPGVASVPATVIVPAGLARANFPIQTTAVGASTPVKITASHGGASSDATLTVTP